MTQDETLTVVLEQARLRRRLPPPHLRRAIRERAGITQTAFARALGVDRASLSRWEGGTREPDDAHLGLYLSALDRLTREALAP